MKRTTKCQSSHIMLMTSISGQEVLECSIKELLDIVTFTEYLISEFANLK